MAKPKPLRVPSDDCAVAVNGETCYPHEGEWVEVVGALSPIALIELQTMAQIGPTLAGIEDVDEREREGLRLVGQSYRCLCDLMADLIVRWNWTDLRGRELPQPADDPLVLGRLHADEFGYLAAVCRGTNPSAEKNGPAPSPITSSDTSIPSDATRGASMPPSLTNVSSEISAPFTRPSPPTYSPTMPLRTG